MSFDEWGYHFEGPFRDPNSFESRSGVYVIWFLCGETWTVLDVGESEDVKNCVINHSRKPCWVQHNAGILCYTVTYTPNLDQAGRFGIELRIRELVKPPCGDNEVSNESYAI